LTFWSWVLTVAGVGAGPDEIATWTRLFLMRNVTLFPEPDWVQPSGYFIENPAERSLYTRKTWLSGMSPVAAERASAERVPAPDDCPLPPLDAACVLFADDVLDELLLDPQPAARPASTMLAAANLRSLIMAHRFAV
jgi:hypothetical protein